MGKSQKLPIMKMPSNKVQRGNLVKEDDGIYLYEIKLLQSAGNIIKLKVDAQTGEIIRVKGRGIERRGAD